MNRLIFFDKTNVLYCWDHRLAWSKGQRLLAVVLILHSSHEPGELSQCSTYNDSTMNVVHLSLMSQIESVQKRALSIIFGHTWAHYTVSKKTSHFVVCSNFNKY